MIDYIVGDGRDVLAKLADGSVDLVASSSSHHVKNSSSVATMPKNMPIAGRWWQKVDRRGPDECWEWLASRDKDGYGKFQVPTPEGQRHIRAHRYGYEMLVGPIEGRLQVCHTCDNPPCCNPAHWFLGTNLENNADKVAKDRQAKIWGAPLLNARKTHCRRGHEFTPENTRTYRGGKSRRCIECKNYVPDHSGGTGRSRRDGKEPDGNTRGLNGDAPRMSVAHEQLGWTECSCEDIERLATPEEVDNGCELGIAYDSKYRPGLVLDPFCGTGTTLCVAELHARDSIGIDLDPRNRLLLEPRMAEVKRSLHGVKPEMPGQLSLI